MKIIVRTKFQLKLTILIFSTKFAQKGCFYSKTEKVNAAIEFYIFELVQVTNFSISTDNFDFLDQICPKGKFLSETKKSEYHQ